MSKKASSGRAARRRMHMRRLVAALTSVGGLNGSTIFMVTALVVMVNVLSGELEGMVHSVIDLAVKCPVHQWLACKDVEPPVTSGLLLLFTLGIFIAAVIWLLRVSKRHRGGEAPHVLPECPRPVKVIVMFLSLPNLRQLKIDDAEFRKRACELGQRLHLAALAFDKSPGKARSAKARWEISGVGEYPDNVLDDFYTDFNWRMNIEALAAQIGKASPLRHVVIVPSSQSVVRDTSKPGSIDFLDEAMNMLGGILFNNGMTEVAVTGCGDIKDETKNLTDCVPYENLEEVVQILYSLTKSLKSMYGCGERDILVDITSGKGITNAAAMAFATLVEERRVQYVDTENFSVTTFDVIHDVSV